MDVRNFWTIVAKNALNALLTNATFMALMPHTFELHDRAGWLNLGRTTIGIVAAREAAVWLPIALKWSTTNADPGVQVVKTPAGQPDIIEQKKP